MVSAEVTLRTESMNNQKIASASGYWILPNVFILNCLLVFFSTFFIFYVKKRNNKFNSLTALLSTQH